MSKKLASGSHNIVLDVKYGSGAFMKTKEGASALARAMIKIGESFGRRVRALVTNMDVPLGFAVGNRIEVWEAIQVLQGRGEPRLREICVSLASNIVALAQNIDTPSAKAMVENAVTNGLAFEKMKEWIKCQGGDVSYLENPDTLLGAKYKKAYIAKNNKQILFEILKLCIIYLIVYDNVPDKTNICIKLYINKPKLSFPIKVPIFKQLPSNKVCITG
jgi:pyrimidine-nucleoside phosphorylase